VTITKLHAAQEKQRNAINKGDEFEGTRSFFYGVNDGILGNVLCTIRYRKSII
jgi:hypothetical protein